MEEFWSIIKAWEPFWQGIFLLLVLSGAATTLTTLAYYIVVLFRGWPTSSDDTEVPEETP